MDGHLVIGGNLGDRRARLQGAVDALGDAGVTVTASSSLYETDPVGPVADQPPYLNAALAVTTALSPEQLIDALKRIERAAGRIIDPADPAYVDQGPRPLDLDVALLGELTVALPRLTVPHPHLLERRFALIPLVELDPEIAMPDGRRLADALARLPLDDSVRYAERPLTLPAAGD